MDHGRGKIEYEAFQVMIPLSWCIQATHPGPPYIDPSLHEAVLFKPLQAHVGPMRQVSRGYLELQSSDPTQHPLIEANYLNTQQGNKGVNHSKYRSKPFQSLTFYF